MRIYTLSKRTLAITMIILLLLCVSTTTANAASKKASDRHLFYGIHTDYGQSFWGIDFTINATYDNSSTNQYIAQTVTTTATINPQHTFGNGDIIIAGLSESVDFGSEVNRNIRPTTSSFWSVQDLIVSTGTKVYYSYKGTPNKSFRYEFREEGSFTFAVSDVYFADPNATLTLSVSGPK